jgi:hypothetical protein
MTDKIKDKARAELEAAVERNAKSGVESLPASSVSPEVGLKEAQEGWDFMVIWDPLLREDEEKWHDECMKVRKYPVLDLNPLLPFYSTGCNMRVFGFERPAHMKDLAAYLAWVDVRCGKAGFELFGRKYKGTVESDD